MNGYGYPYNFMDDPDFEPSAMPLDAMSAHQAEGYGMGIGLGAGWPLAYLIEDWETRVAYRVRDKLGTLEEATSIYGGFMLAGQEQVRTMHKWYVLGIDDGLVPPTFEKVDMPTASSVAMESWIRDKSGIRGYIVHAFCLALSEAARAGEIPWAKYDPKTALAMEAAQVKYKLTSPVSLKGITALLVAGLVIYGISTATKLFRG